MGWLGALASTGLIDGPTYVLLQGELDEATAPDPEAACQG
jgi:hypothetical protein